MSRAGEAVIEELDPKHKPTAPVRGATITIGVSVACAATPQQLQLGGTLSEAVNLSVTPSVSSTQSVTGGGSGGSSGGQGNGSATGSLTEGLSGTAGSTTTLAGNISGTIAPGTSKDIALAKKTLKGKSGYIVMRETMVREDSCLGGSQLVPWATATLSTDEGDVSTTAYGVPLFIKRDEQDPPVMPPKVTADPKPFDVPRVMNAAVSAPGQAPAPKPAANPAPAAKPAPKPAAKPAPKPDVKPAPKPVPVSTAAKPAPAASDAPKPAA